MISNYHLIEAEKKEDLVEKVNAFIKEGWQPYGSLVVKTDKVGRGADAKDVQKYCQPMATAPPPVFFHSPLAGNGDNTTQGEKQ